MKEINIKIDKNLDKFKGKVLFPNKFPAELKEKLNIL